MEMTWGACDPSQPGVLSGRASGLGLAALCHHLVVAVWSAEIFMGSNSIRRHRDLPSLRVCPGVVCISLWGLSLIVTFLTQKVGIVGHGFLSRAGGRGGPAT